VRVADEELRARNEHRQVQPRADREVADVEVPAGRRGRIEFTGLDVFWATPMIPMNGSIGNSARSRLDTGSRPRNSPRMRRTGVNTETLWNSSGWAALARGSDLGRSGISFGSAPCDISHAGAIAPAPIAVAERSRSRRPIPSESVSNAASGCTASAHRRLLASRP
jgi:hypothetical protein